MKRETWGSRAGFILAAVGSAIGLGNIWRFPYMAFENGGGAFLIPYFFALVTAGIPILILEFSLGHKMKGSAPFTFAKLNRKWEWLGWWQVFISFVIAVYYVVIVGWAISYVGYSFTLAWGDKTVAFFTGDFLGLTDSPFHLGGFRWGIVAATLFAWLVSFVVLYAGVKSGIEKANKIFMPLLIVILLIVMVRGVTLPGAADGLERLFRPDFSKMLSGRVWIAAYGQIFFSLSIAFAIMLTYASYLPEKSDIVNNAFMTGLLNCGFSILSGITVFSIIGFMTQQAGGQLPEKLSGVFLAFATIPQAINQLPTMSVLVGVLFFLSLTFAGLSSFISINEVLVSSFADKLNLPRKKVVVGYTLIAGLVSLVFTTGAGLYILDIVDHWVNNFGVVLSGLTELIFIGWICKLITLREHFEPVSDFKVGMWWELTVKFVTPFVLAVTAVQGFIQEFTSPYGGYQLGPLIAYGWAVVLLIVILGVVFGKTKWADPGAFATSKAQS
ncbi:sodium-dependent transporter [Sediminispirochaeta smaragdinae]|jgi:NSS family neurotransmitter:Na+ symporter|uniref:Transporter n=1 Tax=Sediminispirochaeta smaragdinae (strain DSM 11293 / JCM 15392 / SEBR 4228) TaxID=573413 RepID=E1R0V0_SEDSS|nr:sodium-dependent transporter [Sediminispirochaeta smaragdinae]ADK80199.1 sodium:neurotransmitter symporter [Sediminispirochaeta smaragdinae DSM 11293]